MSNLTPPPAYLRIPTNSQGVTSVKPRDICYIEELVGGETIVWHLAGESVKFLSTSITAEDIEQGVRNLDTQWEEYNDEIMNKYYGDK